jgi:hypothetical protein
MFDYSAHELLKAANVESIDSLLTAPFSNPTIK